MTLLELNPAALSAANILAVRPICKGFGHPQAVLVRTHHLELRGRRTQALQVARALIRSLHRHRATQAEQVRRLAWDRRERRSPRRQRCEILTPDDRPTRRLANVRVVYPLRDTFEPCRDSSVHPTWSRHDRIFRVLLGKGDGKETLSTAHIILVR